jgi:hypothetical protein
VYIAVSYNLPARCTVMASVIISIKSLIIAWCMVKAWVVLGEVDGDGELVVWWWVFLVMGWGRRWFGRGDVVFSSKSLRINARSTSLRTSPAHRLDR